MANNNIELQYFEKLSKRKEKWIDEILKDPSGQHLLDSGVDKYSDQAHFIYELLQNADDTNATDVCFDLRSEELRFSHNGTRHFSITNPDTEVEDKKKGKIGDINAIVSYGQSGKKESNEGKIGKFGAGFKSVFQYTTTPEIYDRDFCFKIEKQYIPILIDNNDPRKNKDDTLFILPFQEPRKAYEDIEFKIKSLKLPLLFLNHLETITCYIEDKKFKYTKYIEKEIKYKDSIAQLINMSNNEQNEKLWLFTKNIGDNLQCSVGFFIDDNGYLVAKNYDAFCYFPTKEHTGLPFIVHAPFLLTDSRENIKADEKHNQKMIEVLAELTVSSLLHIRDLGLENDKQIINDNVYINIIPLDESAFTDVGDRDKLSFKPFYEEIKDMVSNEEIIPCTNGSGYVSAENAYWGRQPRIYETFDDEKLALLTSNNEARWVFDVKHNYNSSEQNNEEFYNYMYFILDNENLIDDSFIMNNENLLDLINVDNIEWLYQFYKYANGTESTKRMSKKKEIFLDSNGKPSALFDDKDNEILFLPSTIQTLATIHPQLISDKDTRDFVISLGITEPSKIDQARDGILNKYNDYSYNDKSDFEKLFRVYMKLDKTEEGKLISIIKESNFRVLCTNSDESIISYDKPSNLYFKNEALSQYFKKTNKTAFIDESIITDKQQYIFLNAIGINESLIVRTREINAAKAKTIKKTWTNHNNPVWKENYIDGCEEFINQIVTKKNFEDSLNLWNLLKSVIEDNNSGNLSQILTGKYYYRSSVGLKYDCDFRSSNLNDLLTKKWLFDKDGKQVTPDKVSIDTLKAGYELTSYQAKVLIKSLGILDAKFSNEEAEQIKMGQFMLDNGITFDDLQRLAQEKKLKEEREKNKENLEEQQSSSSKDKTFNEEVETHNDYSDGRSKVTSGSTVDFRPSENPIESLEKLEKEHEEIQTKKEKIKQEKSDEDENQDEDDFIKYTEKTREKIEKKQLEIESEINQIKREQELTDIIAHSKKYSYQWLISLLRKELILTGDEEEERKDLVARFSLVEREENTERTLLLKNPIGKIPASIEEVSDVPMDFVFEDGKPVKIIAEAFSIHSYMVKVKLKDSKQLDNIKLDNVKQINISFKQPSFLLEELIKRYDEMNIESSYDMQANLTRNIDFIFGPPGTGKTTYLADKFLIPKMKSDAENCKIVVLTPTNKAADVIINRVIECMGNDTSYEDWLIRFGTTADEKIDVLPVYKDKHVDINNYDNCVLVTTIHRFWYDFCIGDMGSTQLRDVKWDYIVIDESSMIPLAHILYPLYSHGPRRFVIAGDPFQIQPTITAEEWKDENIYTMINLNEFTEHPDTIPHKYDIKLLMTQYRSIPDVGEVFSSLTYGGKLKHNRSRTEQKKVNFGKLSFNTLNLIKFPVDKFESIYASKYLNHKSPYHVYSALFAYEFVRYVGEEIEKNNREKVSVGIISPYRAQADIIEKLTRNLPRFKNVELNIGTIHSFQGDECDIVICIFNTPPGGLTGKNIFVNNQNIINVAISRARDYLFVIAPDSNTRGIENLDIIKKLIDIMKNRYGYTERDSHSIEDIIFDNPYFLEENAFSTSHQNVNIYDIPEKKYEIRAEDMAVDIQVHMNARLVEKAKESKVEINKETVKQENKTIVEAAKEEPKIIETDVVKEEPKTKIDIDDEDFDSSVYSMHFKLKSDAEKMFPSSKGFMFIDKRPSFVFKVNWNNAEYFELQNMNTEERAVIRIKGKYLNSIDLDKNLEYSYNKSFEQFIISIPYPLLRKTLRQLSLIEKVKSISDEEMCNKLSIKYQD